eukprot:scaffold3567_cov146-Isochrysis_galbana.AAC.3
MDCGVPARIPDRRHGFPHLEDDAQGREQQLAGSAEFVAAHNERRTVMRAVSICGLGKVGAAIHGSARRTCHSWP